MLSFSDKRIRARHYRSIIPAIKQLMHNRDFHKKAIGFNSIYHWSKYQNIWNRGNIARKLAKPLLSM